MKNDAGINVISIIFLLGLILASSVSYNQMQELKCEKLDSCFQGCRMSLQYANSDNKESDLECRQACRTINDKEDYCSK